MWGIDCRLKKKFEIQLDTIFNLSFEMIHYRNYNQQFLMNVSTKSEFLEYGSSVTNSIYMYVEAGSIPVPGLINSSFFKALLNFCKKKRTM